LATRWRGEVPERWLGKAKKKKNHAAFSGRPRSARKFKKRARSPPESTMQSMP